MSRIAPPRRILLLAVVDPVVPDVRIDFVRIHCGFFRHGPLRTALPGLPGPVYPHERPGFMRGNLDILAEELTIGVALFVDQGLLDLDRPRPPRPPATTRTSSFRCLLYRTALQDPSRWDICFPPLRGRAFGTSALTQ